MADDNTDITEERNDPNGIEFEAWYRDGTDAVVQPQQITTQTRYFWKHWVRILGVGPSSLLIRLRMACYYNRDTGERNDSCFLGQDTLAIELGVERRTIMRWMKALVAYDFIRPKKRARWSDKHRRYVRTTNKYLVKTWDPPVPDDQGKAEAHTAQQIIGAAIEKSEKPSNSEKSQNVTLGNPPVSEPVENSVKSQNVTLEAVTKSDSRRGTSKRLLKNVNVASQAKRDDIEKQSHLSAEMLSQLRDRHSLGFYRRVAQRMPHDAVWAALSEVRMAGHSGQIKKSAGAMFTDLIKRKADQLKIEL